MRFIRFIVASIALILAVVLFIHFPAVCGGVMFAALISFMAFDWPYKIIMAVFRRVTKSHYVAMVQPFQKRVLIHPTGVTPNERIMKHENWHIVQIKEHGPIKFVLLYLAYMIWYGYEDNPFEIDAGKHEG